MVSSILVFLQVCQSPQIKINFVYFPVRSFRKARSLPVGSSRPCSVFQPLVVDTLTFRAVSKGRFSG